MFEIKLEPGISLLTATRTGIWSLRTVASYEVALRKDLAKLQRSGRPVSVIVDIRSSGAQPTAVAEALRAMVSRLGPLVTGRTAVVTASGVAKLQAKQGAVANSEIFTSMVLARDWVLRNSSDTKVKMVHDAPSEVETEGVTVHVQGPSDVDINFTPEAALETAGRLTVAAKGAQLAELPEVPKEKPHRG